MHTFMVVQKHFLHHFQLLQMSFEYDFMFICWDAFDILFLFFSYIFLFSFLIFAFCVSLYGKWLRYKQAKCRHLTVVFNCKCKRLSQTHHINLFGMQTTDMLIFFTISVSMDEKKNILRFRRRQHDAQFCRKFIIHSICVIQCVFF